MIAHVLGQVTLTGTRAADRHVLTAAMDAALVDREATADETVLSTRIIAPTTYRPRGSYLPVPAPTQGADHQSGPRPGNPRPLEVRRHDRHLIDRQVGRRSRLPIASRQ